MNTATNTPGTWSVSDKDASGNVSEDYLFIEPGIAVIERKVAGQDECDLQDAHLISASKELQAALQSTFDMLGDLLLSDCFGGEWIDEARAALKKSRGEA